MADTYLIYCEVKSKRTKITPLFFVFLLVLVSPLDYRLVDRKLGGVRKGDSNMRSVTFLKLRHYFL